MRRQHRAGIRVVALAAALVVLLGALLVPTAAAHGGQSVEERRIAQTRARLAAVRAEIGAAKARRDGEAARLAAAERQLTTVLEAVAAAQAALVRQQEAVERARAQLAELQQHEAHRRDALTARVVRVYKQGSDVPFASLLRAGSPADAIDRSSFIEVLARVERATVEGLAAAQVSVAAQRKQLAAQEEVLAHVLAQQRQVLAEAAELRRERALQLAAARVDVSRLQATEQHLEAESRQLAALARRAARPEPASRSLSTAVVPPLPARGGWVWPTRGRVTSGFGRRWGRMHEGIDIGAPTGAPIVAARSGVVSYSGRMSGYGNMVLVNHGGGIVTAYAHQSRILVSSGQKVGAGERIGSVGCTGHCTGPHLHFEVRVNGVPRNPRNYIG